MAENTAGIVAIELLAAAQGVDLRRPLQTGPRLREVIALLRASVPFLEQDRAMAPDIAAATAMVLDGSIAGHVPLRLIG
jgi:histidine ammonia-lyase